MEIKKTNEYVIYKKGDIYRIHYFSDECCKKAKEMKSLVTKNKEVVVRYM